MHADQRLRLDRQARTAYAQFLRAQDKGVERDFEAFCAERLDLADSLRSLRSLHERESEGRAGTEMRGTEGNLVLLSALENVDRISLAFESAWTQGDRPRIEETIGSSSGLERFLLLRTLLLIESSQRAHTIDPLTDREVADRFPDLAHLLDGGAPWKYGEPVSSESVPSAGSTGQQARIGRYEISGVLGQGGMGVVYMGRDPDLDRKVVLKTILSPSASVSAAIIRLKREAKIAGRLDSRGICPVFDVVSAEGRDFVVMPFIEGETLAARVWRAREVVKGYPESASRWRKAEETLLGSTSARVEQGDRSAAIESAPPLSAYQANLSGLLRLVEQIARAVDHAHGEGIVHRDLKPENIMIRPTGQPVVLDFGLASDSTGESLRLTQEGDVLGTPLYMAPEQVEGRVSAIDRRTDVYALGVILYELLTLRPPYEAPTRDALFRQILRGSALSPRKINPWVPRDLETVCLKAMASEPADRYPTALAFAEDLQCVRTLEPTTARPPSPLGRLWRLLRRNPRSTLVAAAGLAVTILATVLAIRLGVISRRASYLATATRILLSVEKHESPRPEDLTALAELLPDKAARDNFLRDPDSEAEWTRIEDALAALTRAGRVEQKRLESPRAAVADRRPPFRFEVYDPMGERWHYILTLSAQGQDARSYRVVQEPQDRDLVTFELPPGEELEPGHTYEWRVRLDPTAHPDLPAGTYAPDAAEFTLVSPAFRSKLLEIPSTGDAAVDRLLRASALLSQRLAEDVLAELDRIPGTAPPRERALGDLLRAKALALVQNREALESLRAGYRRDAVGEAHGGNGSGGKRR